MDFTLACDIMMDVEGSIRPAMYLASDLVGRGHAVSMMSPTMSSEVEKYLQTKGIRPINLHAKLAPKNSGLSLLWLETWAREAFFRLNSRRAVDKSSIVLNFSQVISVPSLVWYLQGPPSVALRDMEKELSTSFRIAYGFLKKFIDNADEGLIRRMGMVSDFVVANSRFCASMYSDFGVRIDDVIYPPIDLQTFHPSTSKPSSDYVLSYFGKETKFSIVKNIADMGVEIKAFGSKTPFVPASLAKHPNIDFMGRVTTDELVDLYSNALFTLFPFTHEPFGYIPLESMACRTPVLTYDLQGPSEYVADGSTGWLARTDEELRQKSLQLWKDGYPSNMRVGCAEAASKFDRKVYVEKWSEFLAYSMHENGACASILQEIPQTYG